MPTKAELEELIESLNDTISRDGSISRRVRGATFENLNLDCDVRDCGASADETLSMWDQDIPLCDEHADQVRCVLRSLGWEG